MSEPAGGSTSQGDSVADAALASRVQDVLRSVQTDDLVHEWEVVCSTDRVLASGTPVPVDVELARAFLTTLEYRQLLTEDDSGLVDASLMFVSGDRAGGVALRQIACLCEALGKVTQGDPLVEGEIQARLRRVGLKAAMYVSTRTLQDLDREARRDELTLLFNRRAFNEQLVSQLAVAVTNQSPLSIAFLDMDGLKKVNDERGHDAGDEYLQGFAADLANSFSEPGETAFRFGGDEYAVLAACTAEDLRVRLAAEELGARPFSYGVSAHPTDGPDAQRLVKLADERMYAHKKSKRRGWRKRVPRVAEAIRKAW